WKVDIGGGQVVLHQREIVEEAGQYHSGVHLICCYVDVEVMAHIKKEWDATDLEWANTEKPLKFCSV
ncbi:unnamed protein product, partial [Effrenium voratum]